MYGLRLFTIIIKTAGNKVRLVWIIPLVLMDHHGFFVNHCWFFLRSLCIIVDYFFDCCRTLGVVLGHWRSMWIVVNYFLGNCCQIFCIVAGCFWIISNYFWGWCGFLWVVGCGFFGSLWVFVVLCGLFVDCCRSTRIVLKSFWVVVDHCRLFLVFISMFDEFVVKLRKQECHGGNWNHFPLGVINNQTWMLLVAVKTIWSMLYS